MTARLFTLNRDEDVSGVSGVGVVAEGIEFSDGVVALRWIVPPGVPGHGFPTSVVSGWNYDQCSKRAAEIVAALLGADPTPTTEETAP